MASNKTSFKKGHKSAGGRHAGVPNHSTTALREAITRIVDNAFASGDVERWLEAVEPVQRLTFIKDLAAYATPKLSSIDASVLAKVEAKPLSVDEAKRMIEGL
jgi:hypothetical protein